MEVGKKVSLVAMWQNDFKPAGTEKLDGGDSAIRLVEWL